jgi:hypothetical protein
MLRSRQFVVLLLAPLAVAGCSSVDDWAGFGRRKPVAEVPVPTSADVVAQHLDVLNRLGSGPPAEQAEIAEASRAQFVSNPTANHKLRYALVLSTPGHGRTDFSGARLLLGEILATPEQLTPAEHALAGIVFRDLNNLLSLQAQLDDLTVAMHSADKERSAAANRRIQVLSADNARLRKEIEAANAKLEAVAELEKALVDRHVTQEAAK